MVSFRESSVTDAVAHTLLTEYFAHREESFPVVQGSYYTAFPAAEHFLPPAGVFLLVVDDDALEAGCGGIRRLADRDDAVRYEVKHLWLRQAARGRGWGRALLAELERHARAFGATEVVLDTNESLAAAGGLYRSSGYREVDPYNDNPNATNWFAKELG